MNRNYEYIPHSKRSKSNINDENEILLSCTDISINFEKFLVKTTDKEIKNTVQLFKSYSIEGKTKVLNSSLASIKKYSEKDLTRMYNKNDIDFNNFCNDVLIYYVVRFVLSDNTKLIPIVKFSEEKKNKPKCSLCRH